MLAAYYAPELATPLQNFIYTVETYEKVKQTGSNPFDNLQGGGQLAAYERNIATGQRTLQNLGMPAEQIDRVRAHARVRLARRDPRPRERLRPRAQRLATASGSSRPPSSTRSPT